MVKIAVTRKVRNHSPLTVGTVMVNNLVHVVNFSTITAHLVRIIKNPFASF